MKPNTTLILLAFWLAFNVSGAVAAPVKDVSTAPAPADPAALQRWSEARFGMFIHWGPVSQTGNEISWSRGGKHISIEQYDQLYKTFNPEKFNADEWVNIARAAGMKYMVLTCKHHDGFCLWPTKQTDYNIMHTPFKRDIVGELTVACKKQGMPFGCYYSTTDWYHPDFPLTSPGGTVERAKSDIGKYTEYLKAQVRELLTGYGPLFTLWFDYPQRFTGRGQPVIDMARSIQPDILVNNRVGALGDYDTPEQKVGAFNRDRPWESCMTIAQQWAWKADDPIKSMKECLQGLIMAGGGDGNFLFNVGPRPDGRIEPAQVARLKEMGDWLSKYGQSIYGTRGGPYEPGKMWGVSTCKGNDIYLHILNWAGDSVKLPPLGRKIVKSELLTGGKVDVKQEAEGITVTVAQSDRQELDTLVRLELDGPATELAPVATSSGSLAFGRKATSSSVYQNDPQYAPAKAFDDNAATRWAGAEGTGPAWLEVDLGQPVTIASLRIVEGESPGHHGLYQIIRFELQYFDQGQWKTFSAHKGIGGNLQVAVKPFQAQRVRINILSTKRAPSIAEFQIYSIP